MTLLPANAAQPWGRVPGVLFIALLVGLSACTSSTGHAERVTRPNIIVFVTDDQRATGTLGVMPETRRLFVEGGTTYPNAYSTTPYCCPSRASIFTGRYTHNHRMYRRADETPDFDQSATLQRYLQESGYRTAMFGKYLNGWDLSADPPYFDDWAIFSKSTLGGYVGGEWNVDGKTTTVERYTTTYLRRLAVRFARSAAKEDRPWALFISTGAPHRPFVAEPKYEDAAVPRWDPQRSGFMERDVSDKPRFLKGFKVTESQVRATRAAQLRTLMSVDDMVEDLYGTLQELGEERDTLSFFLSDNGFAWGEQHILGKMVPYTLSVRVPMMVRWPVGLESGKVDDRLAATIDVAPTVLDAAGIEADDYIDGRSLLDRSRQRDRILTEFWHFHGRPTWESLRTEDYQYARYYDPDGNLTFEEYYDLGDDPGETTNLVVDGVVEEVDLSRIRGLLATDMECRGSQCP